MDSVESAKQVMETDVRYQFQLDGAPLRLDYSHAAQPAAAISASASSDWVCPGCSAVNFSRYHMLAASIYLAMSTLVVIPLHISSTAQTGQQAQQAASTATSYVYSSTMKPIKLTFLAMAAGYGQPE